MRVVLQQRCVGVGSASHLVGCPGFVSRCLPVFHNIRDTRSPTRLGSKLSIVTASSSETVVQTSMASAGTPTTTARVAIALIGPGLIGAALLDQIAAQAPALARQGLHVDVAAIASSKKLLLRAPQASLQGWRDAFASETAPLDYDVLLNHLGQLRPGAAPVVVDCTSSDAVSDHYVEWLQAGMHVVTPNKKVNSGPLPRFQAAQQAAKQSGAQYLSECTVGAGLPVLSTLQTLLDTGDRLIKVEGIFSGTLSYIFNTFGPATPFSEVVTQAKEAGYTEPDPRDDLNGSDVGRKVLTLARLAGAELELADVAVESLVPASLQGVQSAEEYMSRLPEFDGDMAAQAAAADAEGCVLRFVGSYGAENGKAAAGLVRYPKTHPFAQLSGSDNMIVFTTERYNSQPLIVRGPGAGAEVTAAGVFGDIVSLARALAVSK